MIIRQKTAKTHTNSIRRSKCSNNKTVRNIWTGAENKKRKVSPANNQPKSPDLKVKKRKKKWEGKWFPAESVDSASVQKLPFASTLLHSQTHSLLFCGRPIIWTRNCFAAFAEVTRDWSKVKWVELRGVCALNSAICHSLSVCLFGG